MRLITVLALTLCPLALSAQNNLSKMRDDSPPEPEPEEVAVVVAPSDTAPADTVTALAWSPDGTVIAQANKRGVVRLYDVATGSIVDSLTDATGVDDLSFHPDGQWLAAAADEGIHVWDVKTRQRTHLLQFIPIDETDPEIVAGLDDSTREANSHPLSFGEARFTADGNWLVGANSSPALVAWNADFEKQHVWRARALNVYDMGISANGTLVATTGLGESVRLWDATTGESVGEYVGSDGALIENVLAVTIAPDGSYVVSQSGDGRLYTYRTDDEQIKRYGIPSSAEQLGFTHDGEQLAGIMQVAGKVNLITFDRAGNTIRTIVAHEREPRALAIHPSEPWAATSAIDGSIKMWDLVTGDQIRAIGPERLRDRPLVDRTAGVVFAENFDDNTRGWGRASNSDRHQVIRDGVMHFERKKETGYYSWLETPIDGDRDFRIETGVTHIDGIESYSFNLLFGSKDINNNYTFGISGNGQFIVAREVDDEWETLHKWTPHDAVQRSGEKNVIAVEQVGDRWRYLVNEIVVYETEAMPLFGQDVGVAIYNEQTVQYDWIYITQDGLPAAGDPYEPPPSGPVTLFDEPFDDNRNDWTMEFDNTEFRLKDGIYRIDRRDAEYNYMLVKGPFDLSEEFTIESRMRKDKGGNDTVWLGLVWGLASWGDYFDYLIGADGTYNLAGSDKGDYTNVVKWAQAQALERKNEWNTIRIERRATRFDMFGESMRNMDNYAIRWWINDKLVASRDDWPNPYGGDVGFRMRSDGRYEFDYLTITRP